MRQPRRKKRGSMAVQVIRRRRKKTVAVNLVEKKA